MAITKNGARQDILVAELTVTYDDPTSDAAVAVPLIDLPANAVVVGGMVVVDTVFNSTTSDVLDLGDGADDDRYTASQINLQALGMTALTITGYKYTAGDTVDMEWTAGSTGTATTGQFRVILHYVIEGRALENQPVRQ